MAIKTLHVLCCLLLMSCQTTSTFLTAGCDCEGIPATTWETSGAHIFMDTDGIKYDVKLLSALAQNIHEKCVSIARLRHNMSMDTWGYQLNGRHVSLTAQQVLSSGLYSEEINKHCCRIKQADMRFPILITFSKASGNLRVVDGMHRLAKAFQNGLDCVNSVELPADIIRKARL